MSNELSPAMRERIGSGTCALCRRPWGEHAYYPKGNQCRYVAAKVHIPETPKTDERRWREAAFQITTARFM